MLALPELQARFMRAIASGSFESAAALLLPRAGHQERRLGIYANNALENFTQSLRASFPVVLRLVGDDYFAGVARRYRLSFPSHCGDLQYAGEKFAGYLSALHRDDEFSYLGDVAQLEWLQQECLIAPDHAPLDIAALGKVSPKDYDALRFLPHPSVRLLSSNFPVLEIWEANSRDTEPPIIDLSRGGESVLLVRGASLYVERLSDGEFSFAAALQRHETFEQAIAAALARQPDFAAAASLRRLVALGAIVDFSIQKE